MIHIPRRSDIVPPEVMARNAHASHDLIHAKDVTAARAKVDSGLLGEFKKALRELFHNKCAYCESSLRASFGDIDRFRPKKVYWWLFYDWDNMLLSCQVCNVAKADRFPIAGKPAKTLARGADLLAEQPLLLDPCVDHPEEHLVFRETGEVVGLTDRGLVTIDVLHLNRSALIEARRQAIKNALIFSEHYVSNVSAGSTQHIRAQISELLDQKREYAAAVRQALRAFTDKGSKAFPGTPWTPMVQEIQSSTRVASPKEIREADKNTSRLKEAQRSYSIESPNKTQKDLYKRSSKRIERIEFHNFRNFESLQLDMPQVTRNYETWLMLIGENGLGKTSILQGLALALMGQKRANATRMDARRCVRRASGIKSGYVKVTVTGVGDITLSFNLNSPRFTIVPREPKIPLLGYGATRLLPRQLGRGASLDKHIRVDNLFDPTVPLSDANQWLVRQRRKLPEAFEEIRDAFSKLIPEEATLKESRGRIAFSTQHGECRLSELSAGYEAMVALIVDIAIGTSGQWTSISEAEGMVLLDEIEAHLHPQWRMTVVEGLRKAFPRLGFIATTHDPLCLKGLDAGEISVLRRDENGSVMAETHVPSVHDLPADDILTSELFGLPSARNEASPVAIARFSALLGKPRRTAAEETEVARLRNRISAQFSAALTPMQQEVEETLTKALKEIHTQPLPEDAVAEIRRQVLALGGRKAPVAQARTE
jgi:uncharacterized protein (TIGR02646 family)